MSKLTFRAAEDRTGHSIGAIQKAMRRGELESLEVNEVDIWHYGRSHGVDVVRAWGHVDEQRAHIAFMAGAELQQCEDPISTIEKWLYKFALRIFLWKNPDKYVWSENYLSIYENSESEEFLNIERNIKDRSEFSIYSYSKLRVGPQLLNGAAELKRIPEAVFSRHDKVYADNHRENHEKLGLDSYENWLSKFCEKISRRNSN